MNIYLTKPIGLGLEDTLLAKGHRLTDQNPEAIICTLEDKIDRAFLERFSPTLKRLCTFSVGLNHIDLKAAKDLSIAVFNTPDVLTKATAELAFGLMILGQRQFLKAHRQLMKGEYKGWSPTTLLAPTLYDKTLLIVGSGRIGSEVARLAQSAFKMNVLFFKRGMNLHELLPMADVISLHLPLTDETKHFISWTEFSLMKPSALLVNTARGEIIDQEALLKALQQGLLAGAALDVTTPEPLPPSHPLFALDNVFILPHIGSATFEARTAMANLCLKNALGLDATPVF